MKAPHDRSVAAAFAAMTLVLAPGALSKSPAPPFEVAYRAWDVVTELARRNDDPNIRGGCGRTFQPAAVPALRRQTQQEQDAAAMACVQAARSACMRSNLKTTAEIARKCEEFK